MEFCSESSETPCPPRRAGGLCEQRPRSQRQLALQPPAPSCPARDLGSALKMQLAWFSAFSRIQALLVSVVFLSVKIQENREISSPAAPQKGSISKQTLPWRASTCVQAALLGRVWMLRDPGPWPARLLHPWISRVRILESGAALLLPVKGRDQRRQRNATCGPGRLRLNLTG